MLLQHLEIDSESLDASACNAPRSEWMKMVRVIRGRSSEETSASERGSTLQHNAVDGSSLEKQRLFIISLEMYVIHV